MTFQLKRENWKGKYYLVARENGKITSRIRFKNTKGFSDQQRIKYAQDQTFKPNRSIQTQENWKVKEFTDYDKPPSKKKFSVICTIITTSGQRFNGRTLQEDKDSANIEEMKEDAYYNALGVMGMHESGRTDEDEGQKIFNRLKASGNIEEVKYGYVYYIDK